MGKSKKLRAEVQSVQENLYLPTICNPCLVQPNPVKRERLSVCTACEMARYCSIEHQKIDWPFHKPICRVVRGIKLGLRIDNVLKIVANPIRNTQELNLTVLKLKYMFRCSMKRPLEYHEEQVTSFPVLCAFCFSIDYRKLYQCKGCNAVSYCCTEHEEEHYEEHRFECLPLKMHYCKFKTQGEGLYRISPLEGQFCNILESTLTIAMKTMFGIEFPEDPCESLQDYQTFSFVSGFSWIATIVYAMSHLSMEDYSGFEFTICVAGVTNDYVWFTKDHFEYFFACFFKIRKLHIVFVGPELVMVKPRKKKIKVGIRNKVYMSLHKRTLQDYFAKKDYHLKPNMLVFFNCGFSEHMSKQQKDNPWFPALNYIMDLPELPFVFTSYTPLESEFDYGALQEIAEQWDHNVDLETIIQRHENPYRELKPIRNCSLFNNDIGIFYRNYIIQAVRVKFSC